MQSETLDQEFSRFVKEYHEGDDHTKPEAWNLLADYAVDNADAISATLSDKQAGEVKELEEAVRLAEIGEYLYNRAYSYGNGYDEPREFGIEWQWQQSKPNEFGQGALLAEATKWHSDMAEDGIVTEASKLRSALAATRSGSATETGGGE